MTARAKSATAAPPLKEDSIEYTFNIFQLL